MQNKDYEKIFFDNADPDNLEKVAEEQLFFFQNFIDENGVTIEGNVLESGCGTGFYSRWLISNYHNIRKITGVDISERMVSYANSKRYSNNYEAILGDLEEQDIFLGESFNAIISPYILHHFPTCDKVVSNYYRWLKPDSYVILFEPNGSNYVNKVYKKARHIIEKLFGEKTLLKWGIATPNETDHSIEQYLNVFNNNGFELIKYKAFLFDISSSNMILPFDFFRTRILHIQKRILGLNDYTGSGVIMVFKKSLKMKR